MKLKSKKAGSLSRHEARNEKRWLDLESALIESQFDALEMVNPNEAYIDPATGESWLPLGLGQDVDVAAAPFRSEVELRLIRQRARVTALKNPYAKNLLNSITVFTIGKGHKYTATPRKGIKEANKQVAKQAAKQAQRFLDRLLKINKWSKRQRQVVWRYHRDGEVFIRIFFQEDGMTLFRFVEPADVYTPAGETNPASTFGIRTDEEDVETVEAYYVNGESVPVEEIQHRKANVDLNMKRGLSTLFTIREHLDRALKLLRNMSITVANQTALTAIRHHKATGKQIQSFAAKAANTTRYNPNAAKDTKQSFMPPGTTLDLQDGKTRFEFPGSGLNASSPVQVLSAELRAIASSQSWPEFMIGSDSSNANYSSTMVAENPAVKSIETEQSEHIADDLDLIRAAMEHAVNTGMLPAEVLTLVEIEVESPPIIARNEKDRAEVSKTLNEMRIKSAQTIASEFGLDYQQEQANFAEHEDTALDDGALDKPISGGGLPADDVAKTALNGAQVTALANLLQLAATGQIPAGSVAPMIGAAFPMLDAETVQQIVAPLEGFKAKASAGKLAVAA